VKFLLDVSTLVALLWKTHTDHPKASAWWAAKDLVVCPITELGFLRVVTSPAFNASMTQARQVLSDFLSKEAPEFIPAMRGPYLVKLRHRRARPPIGTWPIWLILTG
jgi:predicted nucleic acid-binding protein